MTNQCRKGKHELPWPPTANTYWRRAGHRIHLSNKGRAYRKAVAHVRSVYMAPTSSARLRVHIDAYPPDRRKRDLDNLQKPLLDAMQHAKVYLDDSQIDDLRIVRCERVRGGKVVVQIEELDTTKETD